MTTDSDHTYSLPHTGYQPQQEDIMGLFSRRKPDSIDELCLSLTERWWEWTSLDKRLPTLKSQSGLYVVIDGFNAFFGDTESQVPRVPYRRDEQVREAYRNCLLNRQKSKKANFGDTAKALAQAVLRGDQTAAIGLADWVKENLGEFDGRR